jgi:hypothetical protein
MKLHVIGALFCGLVLIFGVIRFGDPAARDLLWLLIVVAGVLFLTALIGMMSGQDAEREAEDLRERVRLLEAELSVREEQQVQRERAAADASAKDEYLTSRSPTSRWN